MKKLLFIAALTASGLWAAEASNITVWNGLDQDVFVQEVEFEGHHPAMLPLILKSEETFSGSPAALAILVRTTDGTFSEVIRHCVNRSAPFFQGIVVELLKKNDTIVAEQLHSKAMRFSAAE